jgi:hypothetical protein
VRPAPGTSSFFRIRVSFIQIFDTLAGQEAADQIFVGKQKKPLDKGIVTKKGPAPKKGGKK